MTSWIYSAPAHPLVRPIPAFDDNYLWLIRAPGGRSVAVVDPGDARPILEVLESESLKLESILLTHHHADHIGGVSELVAATGARVLGPADERISLLTQAVGDGDQADPALGASTARVIAVPGHTRSHIAYVFDRLGDDPRPLLFCGDTLFAAGCGRVFEGTPAQMLASLDRLAALDPATLVYCAHEYTQSNLKFAVEVESGSNELSARIAEARAMRAALLSTVPSTIAIERQTNPFLRVDQTAVVNSAARRLGHAPADRVQTFSAIREWKNSYR